MIIEPSQAYRTTLKNFFKNLRVGHLKVVTSVEEARREMVITKVGLFVSERNLESRSGLQFCRDIRRETINQSTPFLLLGTENLRQDVVLASEVGVDGYLLKPCSFEDFKVQIDFVISNAQNPTNLRKILERAEQHLRAGETWIAEALFMEAQNIKANSARAMCGLGLIALQGRDFNTAREKFRLAITHNPDYLETYQHLLKLAKESNDNGCLLDSAKILHDMSPDNPRYPLIMADLMFQLDDLESAQRFLKMAETKSLLLRTLQSEKSPKHRTKIPLSSERSNMIGSLDLESDDASILTSIALGYIRKNMLDQAVNTLRLALKVNEKDPEVLYNLALAYELMGNHAAAIQHLRLALAANPLFTEAKMKLQQLNASMEDHQRTESVQETTLNEDSTKSIEKKSA